jgi:hypothetical protein
MQTTGKFTLTADDLVAAALLYSWSGLKRPRVIVVWLVLWFVTVLFIARFATEPGPLTLEALLPHVPALLAVTILPLVLVVALVMVVNPIGARRQYAQQKSLQGEIAIGWSEEGMHFDTEYGAFSMPWNHFHRWVEDKRTFLLFESSRLYRVIPKRVLSEDQQASLRQLLPRIGARS